MNIEALIDQLHDVEKQGAKYVRVRWVTALAEIVRDLQAQVAEVEGRVDVAVRQSRGDQR